VRTSIGHQHQKLMRNYYLGILIGGFLEGFLAHFFWYYRSSYMKEWFVVLLQPSASAWCVVVITQQPKQNVTELLVWPHLHQ